MRRFILLINLLLLFGFSAYLHAVTFTFAQEGISSLPEGAVLVDKHRYFYVEDSQLTRRGNRNELRLKVRVGSNYSKGGAISVSMPWFISNDSRYLFSLQLGDKKIKSSGQFNLVEKIDGIRSTTIEVLFRVDDDFDPEQALLFFTGRPSKLAKLSGATLPVIDQNNESLI